MNLMREHGVTPDVITYNALITACAAGGQHLKALDLLQEMQDLDGIAPDVISYNAAITACAHGGQWQQALQLFEQMQQERAGGEGHVNRRNHDPSERLRPEGHQPVPQEVNPGDNNQVAPIATSTTPRLTRRGFPAASNPVDVEKTSPRVVTPTIGGTGDKGGGLTPTIETYTAVITASGVGGQWETALMLFEEMQTVGGIAPDRASYNATITACGASGRWRRALGLLRDMQVSEHWFCHMVLFIIAAMGTGPSLRPLPFFFVVTRSTRPPARPAPPRSWGWRRLVTTL